MQSVAGRLSASLSSTPVSPSSCSPQYSSVMAAAVFSLRLSLGYLDPGGSEHAECGWQVVSEPVFDPGQPQQLQSAVQLGHGGRSLLVAAVTLVTLIPAARSMQSVAGRLSASLSSTTEYIIVLTYRRITP
ncbi:hypothetical protein O0L34_g8309 [Tuta absoluta]|nr:hypothetical protein O0L34_g8309 [Tuta absoluta]